MDNFTGEICRYIQIHILEIIKSPNFFQVSHTTDDLVFQWLPIDKTPLAVDDGIQLPQLELIKNQTGDCTSVYSTGIVLDVTFHEIFVILLIRADICFILPIT